MLLVLTVKSVDPKLKLTFFELFISPLMLFLSSSLLGYQNVLIVYSPLMEVDFYLKPDIEFLQFFKALNYYFKNNYEVFPKIIIQWINDICLNYKCN